MTYDPTKGAVNLVLLQDGTIATTNITATGSWFQGTIINHLLRSASSTGSQCYLALYNEPDDSLPFIPPPDGAGLTAIPPLASIQGISPIPLSNELSGSGYSRVSLTGKFGVTNASAVNTTALSFNIALEDWGRITHFGILNGSAAGGNSGSLLFYGPISGSKAIHEGDKFTILSGNLTIQLSGGIAYESGSAILNHYLNNVSYHSPVASDVVLALYSVPPDLDGKGGTEIAGGGYARVETGGPTRWQNPFETSAPPLGTQWTYTGRLYTYNIEEFVFSTSISGSWGWVKYFALWDNQTGSDKLLFRGALDPPLRLSTSDGFAFPIQSISIHPDAGRSDTS